MNENDAYIFDVEEPSHWTFNGEEAWISGWFLSKTGSVFSDVRAVTGQIVTLGIFGLPREQIERQHRGYFGLPHAGFALKVRPPRGATELRLELLDVGGRWVEIWRTDIRVKQGPVDRAALLAAVVPDQLRKLLQARRLEPAANLQSLARCLVLESSVIPLNTLPNPPFFGALENPLLTGGSQYGKLKVEGWVIHQEQKIVRLLGTTNPLVENELDYGDRPRPEVAELFPGHPFAARSQFFGMIDISEDAGDPTCLQIYAELTDGTRHLVFARRFYQRACSHLERALPPFAKTNYFAAVRLLISAVWAEKIKFPPWAEFWQSLRRGYELYRRFAPPLLMADSPGNDHAYLTWQHTNRLTPALETMLRREAGELADGPRITVLIDARGADLGRSSGLLDSLQAQLYTNWEAWLVTDAPTPSTDTRIKVEVCDGPADLVRALNAATHQSHGTLLCLLSGRSRLSPDALLEIAEAFVQLPTCRLAYTDEDRADGQGRRSAPNFKPEWSPILADSGLFPGNLCAVTKADFVALGSFRDEFYLIPWFDLLLRLGDTLRENEVRHIPLVCHHADQAELVETDPTHPSVEQARLALAAAAQRRGWDAEPFLPEAGHQRRHRYHQLRWSKAILHRLQVTIVIPTRDRLHLLQECIELLDETVDWRYVKLVVVDDHSRDADAVRYLQALSARRDLMCEIVRTPDPRAPFNYSRLVNAALPHIDTPLLLHLNNDVNALEPGWLEEMAAWFTLPDVGVVGAKLVYPDKTLNHTGIVIGPHGGLADTPFAKCDESSVDLAWHAAAREVSAVTGACLMTRSSIYRELAGFDENDFGVAYNDVDFCLRVRQAGHRIIYTPQAKLMHWGSATRGVTFDEAEHIAFARRYPAYQDPYVSAHLELERNRLVCAGKHFTRAARAGRLRLLLLTHNLNLEGAPLFLLEYATWMAQQAGFSLMVLTSQDGPLREAYEKLGATISVVDRHPIYAAENRAIFDQRLTEVSAQLNWSEIDLVVCNTLVSFWGVHLARTAGKPSLWYIHESTSIFRFFELMLPLDHHAWVHEALSKASGTLFLCQATRAYYDDWNLHDTFRIVPSWIDLATIDRFRQTHDRLNLRQKFGFADDETVIANIGTVCERKGQHVFIRAIDHFNHHQKHRGKFRFVLVGARPGIYLDLLERDIRRLALPNLTLVPETREVFEYFMAADLFVCTSYEESFPRVIMEAMAFATPIVTTNVHGVAEMVHQRQEGYLVDPGDHVGLSRMMWTCIAKERSGKSLTPTAYSRALRFYDHRKVLPYHTDLAREIVLRHGVIRI